MYSKIQIRYNVIMSEELRHPGIIYSWRHVTSQIIFIHLFICSVFNDASNLEYIASNYWARVDNVLVRMQKKAVMANFKVLSQHLRRVIEENHKNLQ